MTGGVALGHGVSLAFGRHRPWEAPSSQLGVVDGAGLAVAAGVGVAGIVAEADAVSAINVAVAGTAGVATAVACAHAASSRAPIRRK